MDLETVILAGLIVLFIVASSTLSFYIGRETGHNDTYGDSCRADRYKWALEDLDKWCGHATPEARLIAKYVLAAGEGHAANAGAPAADEPCTIQGLREQLKRLRTASPINAS